MIHKSGTNRPGLILVTFVLPANVLAERVNLVGDFNDWDTGATSMRLDGTGASWKTTVELPTGRRYRFRYLVDGKQWLNDWHADDFLENPYGSYDSVLDLMLMESALPAEGVAGLV
jgi:1,4-alpha-glucan branching enzyme